VHQMGGLQEAWEGSSDDSMDGIDQMVPWLCPCEGVGLRAYLHGILAEALKVATRSSICVCSLNCEWTQQGCVRCRRSSFSETSFYAPQGLCFSLCDVYT
jgi:hypothetical protein